MKKKKLNPVEFALRYCWIPFLLPANGTFDSFVIRALVYMQIELVTVGFICDRHFLREQIRVQVKKKCQKRAATHMLKSARKKLKVVNIHDRVLVPFPLVDRSKRKRERERENSSQMCLI